MIDMDMTAQEQELYDAIDESAFRTTVVDIEFTGTCEELEIACSMVSRCDIDSAVENDGTIDIWGHYDDTPDEMEWRLKVTLKKGSDS